jgi:hypothetical protein
MRMIWGGLVALLLVSSARGEALWNDNVGPWYVGAYSSNNQTGGFDHCAASAGYKSGVLLIFSVGADYSWSMGFANDNWRLKSGNEYSVRYWIDTNEPQYAMAVAKSANVVQIPLKDSAELFNKFRRGYTLFVSAQSTDFQFSLTDSGRVLTYLLDCARAAGRKPTWSVANSPNPFGPPAASQSSTAPRRTEQSTDAQLAAERAESTLVAANLLSELRVSDFKLLRREDLPEGWKADATWRTDGGVLEP